MLPTATEAFVSNGARALPEALKQLEVRLLRKKLTNEQLLAPGQLVGAASRGYKMARHHSRIPSTRVQQIGCEPQQ